jgi:hypothetical protein
MTREEEIRVLRWLEANSEKTWVCLSDAYHQIAEECNLRSYALKVWNEGVSGYYLDYIIIDDGQLELPRRININSVKKRLKELGVALISYDIYGICKGYDT